MFIDECTVCELATRTEKSIICGYSAEELRKGKCEYFTQFDSINKVYFDKEDILMEDRIIKELYSGSYDNITVEQFRNMFNKEKIRVEIEMVLPDNCASCPFFKVHQCSAHNDKWEEWSCYFGWIDGQGFKEYLERNKNCQLHLWEVK